MKATAHTIVEPDSLAAAEQAYAVAQIAAADAVRRYAEAKARAADAPHPFLRKQARESLGPLRFRVEELALAEEMARRAVTTAQRIVWEQRLPAARAEHQRRLVPLLAALTSAREAAVALHESERAIGSKPMDRSSLGPTCAGVFCVAEQLTAVLDHWIRSVTKMQQG